MENESVQPKQGFGSKVRTLFKLSGSQQDIQAPPVNSENIRQGETYLQWGTRMCGVVSGSKNALSPYLHKVYNHIYTEQANNVELQEQARKNTQAQIDTKKDENANDEKKICAKTEDINDFNDQIDELKTERQKLEKRK
ncbi:MAG: hypothetical protein NC344_10725 [Bacteroidales bacterium]|nr:hypothetical protein [Bacteroidales bacterium]MCM1148279.1 hypothetical protein [Bacteroidales bacterium]MCM1206602.1 hypothetical protein [Bacillota bacterium]MCM1510496.1 hypothetical protein [Clostridium sp.]